MATKLTAQLSKKLTSMGISVKTEEAAREKLLAILAKEGIDGMEGEETEILIDMAESFIDIDEPEEMDDEDSEENNESDSENVEDEEEEEPAEDAKEDEIEALADEVEAEDANAKEEETEEIPEEEDEEESEEVEEKKTKNAVKKEKKVTEVKADKPAKERKMGAKGMKLNPKNIAEDRKYFEPLREFFPDGDFEWCWITSSGVTIKSIGKNGKRAAYSLENVTLQNDNSITCTLYLGAFNKNTEKLEELGLDYKLAWSRTPFVKVTLDEASDIIKQTYDDTMAFVGKIDKRLGDNRKKMKKSMQQSNKTTKKK